MFLQPSWTNLPFAYLELVPQMTIPATRRGLNFCLQFSSVRLVFAQTFLFPQPHPVIPAWQHKKTQNINPTSMKDVCWKESTANGVHFANGSALTPVVWALTQSAWLMHPPMFLSSLLLCLLMLVFQSWAQRGWTEKKKKKKETKFL